MADLANISSARLQEDFDAVLSNGVKTLEASGLLADPVLGAGMWTVTSITRTLVNSTLR